MADLAVWQRTIVDEKGDIIPGAEIEVRSYPGGSLITLYEGPDGTQVKGNPFSTGADGFARFWAESQRAEIIAHGAGSTIRWVVDLINADEVIGDAVSEATAAAAVAVGEAEAAADRAEAARDAAQLNAHIYPSTAAGLAATTDGDYFSVPSGDSDEYLILYRNSSGSAAQIRKYPSAAAVASKADIDSPQFTGSPLTPTAGGLEYDNPLRIANLHQTLVLTRTASFINVSDHTAGVRVLTEAESRAPHMVFTGALTQDIAVEIQQGSAYSYFLRNNTTGGHSLTVRHAGSESSVTLGPGEVAAAASGGSNLYRVGNHDQQQIQNLSGELGALHGELESVQSDIDTVQLEYRGQYSPGATFRKGDVVKDGSAAYYIKRVPDLETINYINNPRFANNRSGWNGGPATGGYSLSDGVLTFTISADLSGTDTIYAQTNAAAAPASQGEVWSMSLVVTNHAAVSVSVRPSLFFLGAGFQHGASVTIPAGQTMTLSHTATAAVPAVTGVRVALLSGDDGVPAGAEFSIRQPTLSQTPDPIDYFDGDSQGGEGTSYDWLGGPNDSPSVQRIARTEFAPGAPGEDPAWIRFLGDIGGGPDPQPPALGAYSPLKIQKTTPQEVFASMTRDRTIGFCVGSGILNMTYDDGETWEHLWTFSGTQTDDVRELANGELLVATGNGKLWVSRGFRKPGATLEFDEVLQAHSPFVKFTNGWSIFEDGNMVLVCDYGGKAGAMYGGTLVPDGENARYAHMSLDYGRTWQTIFDLNQWIIDEGYGILDEENKPQARGVHLHGIAFDKWWDRIWITFGDNATNISGIIYSDDFGSTWRWANKGRDSQAASPTNSRHQMVGIHPMPECILFGSDAYPNGVHRIERSQGKHVPGEYTINVAYAYHDEEKLTHLCHSIYQADHLPGMPVFFAFGAEGAESKSFIVGTYTGFDVTLLWEADAPSAYGRGLRSIHGPTRRGNLIAKYVDLENGEGTFYQLIGEAPIY